MSTLLLIHVGATLAMVGLIWLVQLVHYPLFALVGPNRFRTYHAAHASQITWIVAPVMGIELITALLLALAPPAGVPAPAVWVGLALVAVNWGSTALLQVPLHSRLAGGFDAAAHASLVSTNWIRTAAWTARGALVLWMAAEVAA